MFSSVIYTVVDYLNWMYTFNPSPGEVWYADGLNIPLTPISDQVLIDLEPEINEKQIQNNIQDLLNMDELFPQTEKLPTPAKEFERCAVETADIVPVQGMTPNLGVAEMGVEQMPGHIVDHKPKIKFWAYLLLAFVLLVIIETLFFLIQKYF